MQTRPVPRPVPTELVMDARLWRTLRRHLIRIPDDSNEQLAFLFASPSISGARARLLVRDILFATPDDLERQAPAGIAPKPDFVLKALNRCGREGWSLIETHSHPFSVGPGTTFSGIDWNNDRAKFPSVGRLLSKQSYHATMVVGQDSLDAHIFAPDERVIVPLSAVVTVGVDEQSRRVTYARIPTTSSMVGKPLDGVGTTTLSERFARHEQVFGHAGQQRLASATVAIAGLGGIGSFVAVELAHLGIGRLILIDPDRVEATNLNRLVGATEQDINRLKVQTLGGFVRSLRSDLLVDEIATSIVDTAALEAVKGADVIAGCVDNYGARMVLNQLAIRYLIPLIDAGTGIKAINADGRFVAGGQTQLVVPGCGCLECRGFIDMERAAFDLASPAQQAESRARGYGIDEPAPSVIFLNGVVASTQVAEIVFLLTDASATARSGTPSYSMYDALARSMTPIAVPAHPTCVTCGDDGVLAVGDLAPIIAAPNRRAGSVPDLPTLGLTGSMASTVEEPLESPLFAASSAADTNGSPDPLSTHLASSHARAIEDE